MKNTPDFAKLGALIFSRDQLRMRLMHPSPGPDGQPRPPAPAKALPIVTYVDVRRAEKRSAAWDAPPNPGSKTPREAGRCFVRIEVTARVAY